MKRHLAERSFLVLLLSLAWPFFPFGAFGAQEDIEAKVRAIAALLRCPVCQNLSVMDSPSELAQEMKGLIRERLLQGESEEQVKAYFVQKYGEWVLLAPPKKGFNLLAWTLPFLAILGGLGGIILALRKWVRRGREHRASEPIAAEYQERLIRELKDLDS
ncbi:MAG: cytochrome c-type biogenesis protein CcmH [candidate division NC10 bacterium]|nr:cytochrome c-type biogenesis protein CcmH [candidate division NC10 bacterium]